MTEHFLPRPAVLIVGLLLTAAPAVCAQTFEPFSLKQIPLEETTVPVLPAELLRQPELTASSSALPSALQAQPGAAATTAPKAGPSQQESSIASSEQRSSIEPPFPPEPEPSSVGTREPPPVEESMDTSVPSGGQAEAQLPRSPRPTRSPPPRFPSSSSRGVSSQITASSRRAELPSGERSSAQSSQSASLAVRRSIGSSSSSSAVTLIRLPPMSRPPSLFARENFWYSTPLLPEGSIITPLTITKDLGVLSTNLLLALLTAAVLGLMAVMLPLTLLRAPVEVHRFLQRLPLSAVVFLVLLLLRSLLFPTAAAQGVTSAGVSPVFLVPLYGVLFFLVAGLTNFVCNNLIAAEAETLERMFLPLRASGREAASSWKRSKVLLLLFFILYAVVGAHISPSFFLLPLSQPGITLVAFVTILVAAYVKDGMRYALAAHRHWGRWLEANAVGLLLAVLSIWMTRRLGLTPGYLFGVPAGIVIASREYSEREGPFEWSGLLAMLLAAFVAWLLLPLSSPAPVIEDFLMLLIVILIEACFIESLPFPYLAGASLYRWRRWVWVVQCTLVSFLVLQLLWNPSSTIGTLAASPPALTYVLLLALYAVSVLLLVLYCRIVRKR